ncbi:MAG TPA: carboxypeptidase regulatory-like domain-containing protein, partial [Gemmatimonadaceae bacterium]
MVHDPEHRPIPGATVNVRAAHSDLTFSAVSNPSGEFTFPTVPLGDYIVTISKSGFDVLHQTVTVASDSALVLHFMLSLASVSQSVTVTAAQDVVAADSVTPTTQINRVDIARTPGADRTNSLAMITDFVPGAYMTHDMLHMRGGHQLSWLIDGVQIPNTNIASNIAPQIDPKDIDTLEIDRGSYNASLGDRTYGIFNVVPRSGFERNRDAELVLTAGNFDQANAQLSLGDHTQRFAWYVSLNGNRSNDGLQPATPAPVHDAENGYGGFVSLIGNLDP